MLGLALAGCAPQLAPAEPGPAAQADDAHIPPFARWPYQRFSREAAVQIALREWRAFGSAVVYPNQELPYDAERTDGLWQRVGEYWWLGLPMGAPEQGFTGMHNENGAVFPASQDGNYAWSAAFIDYVMRMAGAGHRFLYSPTHSEYINAAKEHALGQRPDLAITAKRPENYAPQLGDLICMWRGRHPIRYDDLPTGRFPGIATSSSTSIPARSTGSAAMSTTRSRCGTSRSPRMAISPSPTARSSTPITRGSSCSASNTISTPPR